MFVVGFAFSNSTTFPWPPLAFYKLFRFYQASSYRGKGMTQLLARGIIPALESLLQTDGILSAFSPKDGIL